MSNKMQYSIFNKRAIDATQEPLFLGESVNVSRYDVQHYPIFEKIIEKQTSFFWRPEEIDISKDRIDFQSLSDHEKHIFTSNLKYQTLLDSIQGRSPNIALLPLVSVPELETWIETWSYFETIHSRSYTHIIRNIYNDPSVVFDDIMLNEHIMKRAGDIAKYYDDLIEYSQYYNLFGTGEFTVTDKDTGNQRTVSISLEELKKKLYMCIVSVYALEAIRFYVSFACSFAFAERELMEGNAKIIKLVARDEHMHMSSTQHILSILSSDNEWTNVIRELSDEVTSLFKTVVEQEKEWAEYLFKDGSMIGLNKEILCQYIEYMANNRTAPLGITVLYPNAKNNPIPWINAWLSSDNVQVAPQEVEITSYLVGQIDAEVNKDDLADFEL